MVQKLGLVRYKGKKLLNIAEMAQRNSVSEDVSRSPLQLLLLGDCMLRRLVNEVLENAPPEYHGGKPSRFYIVPTGGSVTLDVSSRIVE